MKAAQYARFSSDLQRETSIDDQFRVCRDYAAREGHMVIKSYADKGISAATIINRPDLMQLMADARAGVFEVLIVEAIDRLSRNQRDIADIYQNMAFCGIPILSVSEGEISELHIGLKGTMNAMFRKDLAFKVKRGQIGRLEAGRVPAGLAYGYELGLGIERGIRTVNPEKALIIRWIYDEYIGGISPRAICKDLNARNIPGPSGGVWNPSAIHGSRKRRCGILENPIYVGQIIYGRQSFIVDPQSGKTIARVNPESEWEINTVPELAIVTPEQWAAVRARKDKNPSRKGYVSRKYLISGLVKCGHCNGNYTSVGDGRFGCYQNKNRGTCDNKQRIKSSEAETRIMSALRRHLLDPEYIQTFIEECRAEWAKLTAGHGAELSRLSKQRQSVTKKIDRLVYMIEQGSMSDAITAQISAREAELRGIDDTIAAQPDATNCPIPKNLTQTWASMIQDVETAIRSGSMEIANTILRRELQAVTLNATSPGNYTLTIGALVGRGRGT